MNKKAFTLAELLGVIVLIGIIVLITVPSINGIIERNKVNAYNEQVDRIVTAFKNYVVRNSEQFEDRNGANSRIELRRNIADLQNTEFLKSEDVISPLDDQVMTGCLISFQRTNSGRYEYFFCDGRACNHASIVFPYNTNDVCEQR